MKNETFDRRAFLKSAVAAVLRPAVPLRHEAHAQHTAQIVNEIAKSMNPARSAAVT